MFMKLTCGRGDFCSASPTAAGPFAALPKQADAAHRFFLKCRSIRDASRKLHGVYMPPSGIYSLFIRTPHFRKNILNERCRTGERIMIFQFSRMH